MLDLIKEKYAHPKRLASRIQVRGYSEAVADVYLPPSPDVDDIPEQDRYHRIEQLDGNGIAQAVQPNYALFALIMFIYVSSVSLIVYGGVHLNDCPAQRMIAISYMVMGAIFIVSRILNSRHDFLEAMGRTDVSEKPAWLIRITLILQCIILVWFVVTCYWVYSIRSYIDKKNPDSPKYCSGDFYKNVFWGSSVALVFLGFIIIAACVIACCIARKK